jgi:hypothetical protein
MKLQENKCAGCPTRRFRFNTRLHYTIIKASIQKPTRLGDESKTEINGTVVPEHSPSDDNNLESLSKIKHEKIKS